ncbi:MAG: hypothetical protein WCI64_04645 [Chlorobium sp.]
MRASLLDLGGSGAGANPQGAGFGSVTSGSGITVQMVTLSTPQSSGLVTVAIPSEMLRSGTAFTILLPPEVSASVATTTVVERVSLEGGASLPSWIQYNVNTKSFSVDQAPEGALPLTVEVNVGDKRWTMVISKKN